MDGWIDIWIVYGMGWDLKFYFLGGGGGGLYSHFDKVSWSNARD